MVSALAAIALGCVIGCDQRDSELTFTDESMLSTPAPSARSISYAIPEWGVRFGSVQSVENYPVWTTNAANKVYALATGINNYKWDWSTQITNAPGFLASESDPTVGWTNGTLYVHGDTIDPVQYQQDYSVILPKLIASSGSDGAELNSVGFVQGAGVKIPTGAGIYSAVLGLNAISTNQFAFVYSGRGENQYYSHGNGTFNIDPVNGLAGFWIGETNLTTVLTPVKTTVNTTKGLVSITAEQQAAITELYPNISNGAKVILMKNGGTGPNEYPGYDLYLGSASGGGSMFGSCELYPDGTIRLFAGIPDLVAIFGQTKPGQSSWLQTPAIVGYEPYYYAYQGTKLTPYDEVKDMISDAIPNQIVTRINGKTGGLDIGVFGDETSVSVKTNFPGGIEIGSVIVQEGWHSVSVVEEDQSSGASGFNPVVTNKLYVPSNLSAYNNDAHYTRASLNEITDSPRYPNLCLIDDTDSTEYEVPYIQYLSGGSESFAMRVGGLQFYPENWVTETITNGLISQAWVNSQPFVKTNAQGTLVVGPNQYQPNGGHWSMVVGGGGSQTKSDNTIILSPGSNIGANSSYSAVFGPGAYIHDNAQYSFAFGGGVNIQDNCNDSFVVGSGAQSAHKCAFLWSANSNGGRSIPAQPITHGNGTFNINTYDGVAGVYIGDTNLQQIIRMEARAMIGEALADIDTNIQTAEDARVVLTNLITILKNGTPSSRERLLDVERQLNELMGTKH